MLLCQRTEQCTSVVYRHYVLYGTEYSSDAKLCQGGVDRAGSEAQAERFLAACRLVNTATSFGGIHTTAERRARWKGDAIPDGFIRLSAGCEEMQDLLEDISQALDVLSL